MIESQFEGYELSRSDIVKLTSLLSVPVPEDEAKRLEILRQSKLLDSNQSDHNFDRFTSLVARLYNMPIAVVALVDVDRTWYKSKIGLAEDEHPRDRSFDAYTVLPDSPDVLVVMDVELDTTYHSIHILDEQGRRVVFYAGAALLVEGVKVGSLSIMDTQAHPGFDLSQRMNLLDLGAGLSYLIASARRSGMNLNAERANLVVSMMHNLRTPMTSLSFATSLMESDIEQLRSESEAQKARGSDAFQTVKSNFGEISDALSQLNVLVDSSLSLGQAIINCNTQATCGEDAQTGGSVECDLLYSLESIYNAVSHQFKDIAIEWVIDSNYLRLGPQVSYPDALLLILFTAVGQVSSNWKRMQIRCFFEPTSKEELEFPQLANEIIEGCFFVKVCSLGRQEGCGGDDKDAVHSSNRTSERFKFLSMDKILKSIKGGCKETEEEYGEENDKSGFAIAESRAVQEFWMPCKVLLTGLADSFSKKEIPTQRASFISQATQDQSDVYRIYTGDVKEQEKTSAPLVTSEDDSQTEKKRLSHRAKNVQVVSSDKHASLKVGIRMQLGPSSTAAYNLLKDAERSKKEDFDRSSREKADTALRVLVVEDTISVQKLLTRWLQKNNCVVQCANNGKVGLEYMKTYHYDMVIIDFLMPIQLGITTLQLFRSWRENNPEDPIAVSSKEMLVIGMSATALDSEHEEGFANGMHFFCTKPVDLKLLRILLNSKIDSSSNEEAVERICNCTNTFFPSAKDVIVGNNQEKGEEGEGEDQFVVSERCFKSLRQSAFYRNNLSAQS